MFFFINAEAETITDQEGRKILYFHCENISKPGCSVYKQDGCPEGYKEVSLVEFTIPASIPDASKLMHVDELSSEQREQMERARSYCNEPLPGTEPTS